MALDFSVVLSREGLYPRGNFSTTSSSKQFFLSLAKYKLLLIYKLILRNIYTGIIYLPPSTTTQRPQMVCSTILAIYFSRSV